MLAFGLSKFGRGAVLSIVCGDQNDVEISFAHKHVRSVQDLVFSYSWGFCILCGGWRHDGTKRNRVLCRCACRLL